MDRKQTGTVPCQGLSRGSCSGVTWRVRRNGGRIGILVLFTGGEATPMPRSFRNSGACPISRARQGPTGHRGHRSASAFRTRWRMCKSSNAVRAAGWLRWRSAIRMARTTAPPKPWAPWATCSPTLRPSNAAMTQQDASWSTRCAVAGHRPSCRCQTGDRLVGRDGLQLVSNASRPPDAPGGVRG